MDNEKEELAIVLSILTGVDEEHFMDKAVENLVELLETIREQYEKRNMNYE